MEAIHRGLFVIDEVFTAGQAMARPHLELEAKPAPARTLNVAAYNEIALPEASVETLDGACNSCNPQSLLNRYSAAPQVLPSQGLEWES